MKQIYQVMRYHEDNNKIIKTFNTLKIAKAFVLHTVEQEEIHMLSDDSRFRDTMNNYRIVMLQTIFDINNSDKIGGNSNYPMTQRYRVLISKVEARYNNSANVDYSLFKLIYKQLGEFKQDLSSYNNMMNPFIIDPLN